MRAAKAVVTVTCGKDAVITMVGAGDTSTTEMDVRMVVSV